jgi:hypothetical protein
VSGEPGAVEATIPGRGSLVGVVLRAIAAGQGGLLIPAHKRGLVAVRDSKDPAGPALVFAPGNWQTFTTAIKSGEFGLS